MDWLRCLRRIEMLTAMLLAELHDVQRFPTARSLMAYRGLVPGDHSSGGRHGRGRSRRRMTPTTNSHTAIGDGGRANTPRRLQSARENVPGGRQSAEVTADNVRSYRISKSSGCTPKTGANPFAAQSSIAFGSCAVDNHL